ncbi:metallophosphoesterase [Halovivax limisalsi]|uniref:metallophosphoesterase n=1 Tax=Halovivax limisalsi TaxID=1453760 RepID=UPI001FFD493B|nr:metallophosphoesterase [Halovivax limisalsi]
MAPDAPFSFAERAVYVRPAETVVLADIHLGRGEASAVDAPIDAAERVVSRLDRLLDRFEPETVVVAGDLLHSFSWVPRGVRETVERIETRVDDSGATLVCTPGNHDRMLEDVFAGETADAYRLADGRTIVSHGHEHPDSIDDSTSETNEAASPRDDSTSETDEPTPDTDDPASHRDEPVTRIFGHDHPALATDGRKRPCFLYGPPGRSGHEDAAGEADEPGVLVLPAFSQLARGTKINDRPARDFQSPLLSDVDGLYPIVRDDDAGETHWFPRLGKCRHVL